MRILPGLAVVLFALLAFPLADAHPAPLQTYPAAGERLAEGPEAVWVNFAEIPDPATIDLKVVDQALKRVDLGDQEVQGVRATVSLEPGLPDGVYVVKWETDSLIDGHHMQGSWSFVVGNATPFQADTTAAGRVEQGPFPWPAAAGKAIAFIGLAMACGAIVTRGYVLPRSARERLGTGLGRFEQAAVALQVAGLVVILASQADASGVGMASYARETAYGKGLFLRLALAIALLAWIHAKATRAGPAGRWIDLALAAGTLVAFAAYSHTAASLHPFALGVTVNAAHLASVMGWTGGLACLAILLRTPNVESDALAETTRRFSTLATACLAVLFASGLVMLGGLLGWNPLGWAPHLRTGYGRVLATKLLLVAAMMGLGALSRYRFMAGLAGPARKERRRGLRLNVRREACLGIAVLALAAVLTNLAPGLPDTEPDPFSAAGVLAACSGLAEPMDCQVDRLEQIQTLRDSTVALDILSEMMDLDQEVAIMGHSMSHELGRNALALHGTIQETLDTCPLGVFQGCIHGALQSYFDSLDNVDQDAVATACPPRPTAFGNFTCLHGAGHGILIATDYDLNRTLDLCDGLATVDTQNFCYHGAFMENGWSYTLNRTGDKTHKHGDGGHGSADPDDLHYPCNAVAAKYGEACWALQPQLMLFLNGYDFRAAGDECATVEPTNDLMCYIGLGAYVTGYTGHDAQGASAYCGSLSSREGRYYCIQGFIRSVVADYVDPDLGLTKCKEMARLDKRSCYSGLGYEGKGIVGVEGMASVCARAEAGYENLCRFGVGLPPR